MRIRTAWRNIPLDLPMQQHVVDIQLSREHDLTQKDCQDETNLKTERGNVVHGEGLCSFNAAEVSRIAAADLQRGVQGLRVRHHLQDDPAF